MSLIWSHGKNVRRLSGAFIPYFVCPFFLFVSVKNSLLVIDLFTLHYLLSSLKCIWKVGNTVSRNNIIVQIGKWKDFKTLKMLFLIRACNGIAKSKGDSHTPYETIWCQISSSRELTSCLKIKIMTLRTSIYAASLTWKLLLQLYRHISMLRTWALLSRNDYLKNFGC